MTVTERHQGLGAWSLRLREDTPQTVLRDLDPATVSFGHVVITSTHLRLGPLGGDPDTLLAKARYTGVIRSRPSLHELGGAGLAFWLGDEDGKGRGMETVYAETAGSFSTWVGHALRSGLDLGTVASLAGTLNHSFVHVTGRTMLEYVCDYFDAEWRINPDGTLDAGEIADLFVTTPTLIVRKGSGGRDQNVDGIAGQFSRAVDYEDYTTKVVVLATGADNAVAVGSATISPATTFYDLDGALLELTRIIESLDTKKGNETAVAQAQLNRFTSARTAVTVTAAEYDIGRKAAPGDAVWIFDPDNGLFDLTNQVPYRGSLVYPIELRLLGLTWPVQRGMGVYVRPPTADGTPLLDLTEWVAWEDGHTQLEVGAKPRSSSGTSTAGGLARPAILGPAGLIGYAAVTSNQTGISSETDLTGLSRTVTVGPGRRLRVRVVGRVTHSNAGSRAVGRIKEGTTTLGLFADHHSHTNAQIAGVGGEAIITPTEGTHTYKATLQAVSGAGTVDLTASSTGPAVLEIEDLGAAP